MMTLPTCKSDVFIADVQELRRKGVNLDDVTLQWCTNRIPELWPNTVAPISSLRTFRPWDPGWNRPQRLKAMNDIVHYATSNGVKVLLGASIGCLEMPDEENWRWTKDLLQMLGPKHVMGLAVGNDMDLFYQLKTKSCAEKIWDKGFFWKEFQRRVADMDDMGFNNTPVTVVLSTESVQHVRPGNPFVDISGQALINSFLQNATQKYNKRFVFTFNIDPYYDFSLRLDPGSNDTCTGALKRAQCWELGCSVPDTMALLRRRIEALTGVSDYKFWVGELGWANKNSSTLRSAMRYCPEFSSNKSVEMFYRGFLSWEFTLGDTRPPDHMFWRSLRNAPSAVGVQEYFGLISTCETDTCKIFASNITEARDYYGADLWWMPWIGAGIIFIICLMTIGTSIYVSLLRYWGVIKREPVFSDVTSEASVGTFNSTDSEEG